MEVAHLKVLSMDHTRFQVSVSQTVTIVVSWLPLELMASLGTEKNLRRTLWVSQMSFGGVKLLLKSW